MSHRGGEVNEAVVDLINDEPRKFYPPKFYLWLTYIAREGNPRKLNREKFGQGSSAKILVLENF